MLVDGEKLLEAIEGINVTAGPMYIGDLEQSQNVVEVVKKLLRSIVESCKVDIQPPARIEAAIRMLHKRDEESPLLYHREQADLLRWVLGQKQETWTDKDFGLDKEQEEK